MKFRNRPLIERLERKRRRMALVMGLERLTLALWRPLIWGLFFCALWLFQMPSGLGSFFPGPAAILFWSGLAWLLYKDFFQLRRASQAAIDRRLEENSNLQHRPLSTLQDTLANPEKTPTKALWNKSRRQILRLLPLLKAGKPKAFMARRDPYALRLGVALFFMLGIFSAGPEWKERIGTGLAPPLFRNAQHEDRDVTLRIQPPGYTKQQEIVLQNNPKIGRPLKVPTSSLFKIRVQGGWGRPYLVFGGHSLPMKDSGDNNYALEIKAPPDGHLKIRQFFFTRAAWDFQIIPDHPPQVSMAAPPEALSTGALRFSFKVKDDYGVKTLGMHMRPENGEGEATEETRSVVSPPGADFKFEAVYDMTGDIRAGRQAVFTFTVLDDAGQSASTMPLTLTLPERIFRHPVARELIALRKSLALDPDPDFESIAQAIEILMARPEDYGQDEVVFLSLRSAASRLFYSGLSSETISAVTALLWDTALRIEDGDLSLAARDLRDAQKQLEEALKNPDIPKEEIARLMHQLREGMANYFTELQKELQKRAGSGQDMPMIPPEMLSKMIDPAAIESFLSRLEANMLSGDRGAAQDLLAQLQRMTDMMNPAAAGPLPADMQKMNQGIKELQALIERQERLLERTRDPASTIPAKIADLKTEQDALRNLLEEFLHKSEKPPENISLASQDMLNSSQALDKNRADVSVPHQVKALEHLRQAQEEIGKQFLARLQQMTGMMFGGNPMQRDPLGRPYGMPGIGSGVKIPDEQERKQALEILRLLQQRSGEFNRPGPELDYYRRLLRQF